MFGKVVSFFSGLFGLDSMDKPALNIPSPPPAHLAPLASQPPMTEIREQSAQDDRILFSGGTAGLPKVEFVAPLPVHKTPSKQFKSSAYSPSPAKHGLMRANQSAFEDLLEPAKFQFVADPIDTQRIRQTPPTPLPPPSIPVRLFFHSLQFSSSHFSTFLVL